MKLKLESNQQIYFSSDTHYMHSNICRGTTKWRNDDGSIPINLTRNFKTIDEMNNTLVDNINSKISENDILFHLGDWSFGGFEYIEEFRKRIKCKNIHLILGNHDHHIERNKHNIRSIFTSVHQYLELCLVKTNVSGSLTHYNFILMHYPIASWNNMKRGVIHLHGHVHLPYNQKIAAGKAMDVGVDGNNLDPYSLTDIITIMHTQPIAKLSLPIDHHEITLISI